LFKYEIRIDFFLYYYVFFLPKKEEARLDHEKQVERERIYNLELADKYQATLV